jgi:enoyl-CoA hydratase/carnithine racemase
MSQKQSKSQGPWLPTPRFEDYKEFFKPHFELERRDDGVLYVCMHTAGGEVQWNAELHRAIWQLFRTIGSDPENEVLIFTAKGDNWMSTFDTASWAQIENEDWGGDQGKATYENMYYDGRNMLISLIHDVEFPTICAFPGFGFHSEIGLMMDIAIAADDAIIVDKHYDFGLVPGDGIHSCFLELMGTRRGVHALWTGKAFDAQAALEAGLIAEVVPKDKLVERAYEIADTMMGQPRHTRRLTTQVLRRPWKQRIVDDLDGAFGIEMYVDMVTKEHHTEDKAAEIANSDPALERVAGEKRGKGIAKSNP